MKPWIIKLLLVLMLSAVALGICGCGKSEGASGTGSRFTIVTSFYPIYIYAKNIAGDMPGVRVVNMTGPQTGCLHDYQLSPADLKTLHEAQAFVINGAGMEAFLDKVTGQMPGIRIVDASKGIELINNKSDGQVNPHVWVSITNAILQAENIGAQLAEIDAGNAERYKKNTVAYVKKLESQREKMHKALDSMKNRNIITFHEAFPYFAREFNLNIAAVIEREPGSEPSAGELSDIIGTVRGSGVKALFAEPQYSARAAQTIARETGAKVYILDPVVWGPEDGDCDAYIKAMDENLKTLEEALK